MGLSLAQLLAAPSVDAWRSMIYGGFQGLGIVVEGGVGGGNSPIGTGGLSLSGTPIVLAPKIIVTITTVGELGTAIFSYSLDGGVTVNSGNTVPASPGLFVLGATGVSITFSSGPIGAGVSFAVGDTFTFAINTPTLQVTSWPPSGGYRQLAENQAQALAKLSAQLAGLAAGGFTPLATGSWCDLIGTFFYGLPRLGVGALAGFTKGLILLTDAAGAGPFTLGVGSLGVASTGGLLYFTSNGGTLPKNGTLVLSVAAQQSGSVYNVGNNTIQSIVSGTLPGVTVNNPNPGSGTWITSQGTDPETDSAYMLRCQQRWTTLGSGSSAASYQLWATLAEAFFNHVSTITKTLVQPDFAIAGQINIIVAGASGSVSGGAVTDVINYVTPKVSQPATLSVVSATNAPMVITGVVNFNASKNSSAVVQAAVSAALIAYFAPLAIGNGISGQTSTVWFTEVDAAIGSVLGGAGIAIRNIAGLLINGGSTDIPLTLGQDATLTNSLTFVGV